MAVLLSQRLPAPGSLSRYSSVNSRRLSPQNALVWTSPFDLTLHQKQVIHNITMLTVPTYVSRIRRQLTLELLMGVLLNRIPGDIVETGVAKGGTVIIMLKLLEIMDPEKRVKVFAADSFQGLPPPSSQDHNGTGRTGEAGEFAFGEDVFVRNLLNANVFDMNRVRILKGWFSQTLPNNTMIEQVSFLRLDGDLYDSTMDALQAVYDKVSVGGIVYVDDYGSFSGCLRAINEFRERRGISSPIRYQYLPETLYNGAGVDALGHSGYFWEAVWWMKE